MDQLEDDAIVLTASSTAYQAEHFKFNLMGAVVGLIVLLAGSLALVVLFTLAHTNVSERCARWLRSRCSGSTTTRCTIM